MVFSSGLANFFFDFEATSGRTCPSSFSDGGGGGGGLLLEPPSSSPSDSNSKTTQDWRR